MKTDPEGKMIGWPLVITWITAIVLSWALFLAPVWWWMVG
jgi:hypothetical protein